MPKDLGSSFNDDRIPLMPRTCYYCGVQLDSSNPSRIPSMEHVPPRILYGKVRSHLPDGLQAPTVPSCPAHNTRKCGDENLDQKIIGTLFHELTKMISRGSSVPALIQELVREHQKTIVSTRLDRSDVPVLDSSVALTRTTLSAATMIAWHRMLLAGVLTHVTGTQLSPSCWSGALSLLPWVIPGTANKTEEVDRHEVITDVTKKIYDMDQTNDWGFDKGISEIFPAEIFSVKYAVNSNWELIVNTRLLGEFISIHVVRGIHPDLIERLVE